MFRSLLLKTSFLNTFKCLNNINCLDNFLHNKFALAWLKNRYDHKLIKIYDKYWTFDTFYDLTVFTIQDFSFIINYPLISTYSCMDRFLIPYIRTSKRTRTLHKFSSLSNIPIRSNFPKVLSCTFRLHCHLLLHDVQFSSALHKITSVQCLWQFRNLSF